MKLSAQTSAWGPVVITSPAYCRMAAWSTAGRAVISALLAAGNVMF